MAINTLDLANRTTERIAIPSGEMVSLFLPFPGVRAATLAPNGAQVAFNSGSPPATNRILRISTTDNTATPVCSSCGYALEWLPDSRSILTTSTKAVEVVDSSGRRQLAIAAPDSIFGAASVSTNGRWIVFTTGPADGSRIATFVAPFRLGGHPAARAEWIQLEDWGGFMTTCAWVSNRQLVCGKPREMNLHDIDFDTGQVGTHLLYRTNNRAFEFFPPVAATGGRVISSVVRYNSKLWMMSLPTESTWFDRLQHRFSSRAMN